LQTPDDAVELEKLVSRDKVLFTREDQINFAWRNFEDQQAIIRAADLKAGYLVTFLLFFGASTIPLGKEVLPALQWATRLEDWVSALYLISYGGFVLTFVWSLYLISHVLTPRVARHSHKQHTGTDLLYYEHVLHHENNDKYFEGVSNANSMRILRNITDQVFELSFICKAKMDALRSFSQSFKWTLAAWVISTGVGFWIKSWK
jgi:hypothetical protein